MLRFDDPISWRLWVARKQAASAVEPDRWSAEIAQIERLLQSASESVDTLVGLLVQYAGSAAESHLGSAEEIRSSGLRRGEGDPSSELLHIVELALLSLGSLATQEVLRGYSESLVGSAERLWLLATLVKTGDPRLEPLFRRLADDPQEGPLARRGLDAIRNKQQWFSDLPLKTGGAQSEYESILAALRDANYFVRWRAADALSERGDAQALPALTSLLQDPSEHVREAARDAISAIERRSVMGEE